MTYNITNAIKQSRNHNELLEVLVGDLSHALSARVRALDRDGLVICHVGSVSVAEKHCPIGADVDTNTVLPLLSFDSTAGKLEISRKSPLSLDEFEYVKNISIYISLVILGIENARPKASVVKASIGTLSYSELEALIHIFDEIEGHEGLIIASKVAEKHTLSRSAIVNGLRKLESAGLIEARSLGVKGTYIKILNEQLITELDKFDRRGH